MIRNQGTADDEGIDSVNFDRCAACGESLETEEWQPVETVGVDGEVRLQAFCDEACRKEFVE